jgi:DNA-binding IscR family transcriptional regulator
LISVDLERLRSLASKQSARSSPLDRLTAQHRSLLERFDWEKAKLRGPQQGFRVVTLCAAIGGARRCTTKKLAADLGWSDVLTDQISDVCRKLGLLTRQRPSGADMSLGSLWTVSFDAFKRYAGPQPHESNRVPTFGTRRRPLKAAKPRVTRNQSHLLSCVDWKSIGAASFYQWLNGAALIGVIGNQRRATVEELAADLGTSRSSIRKISVPLVKRGIIKKVRTRDPAHIGPATDWIVDWDKIKDAAGEQPTPPAKFPAARKRAEATTPPRSGRPQKWTDWNAWLERYVAEHPAATAAVARQQFRGETPKPAVVRAQISRLRKPK